MDNHQAIWDSRYEKILRGERTLVAEPWLEGWLHLVPPGECRRALDVGGGEDNLQVRRQEGALGSGGHQVRWKLGQKGLISV